MAPTLAPRPPLAPPRTRDQELVRFVGRHGLVAIRHVMAQLDVGRTAAYRRVAGCIEAGLLERLDLLCAEPGLLRASRDGLRYAGLGLPLAPASPGNVEHTLRCVSTAQLAAARYGEERVLTERELVLAEQIAGKPIVSADLGERHARPHLHRPDLAIFAESGPIVVEVELSAKAPYRLQGIIRAWRYTLMTRRIAEVHYLCAPGQARAAVERAVYAVKAEQFVSIGEVAAR
jgi:hypothetical protein